MVLYIEYIILDNLIIDFLIFKLIEKTIKKRFGTIRKIISALFGVVFAFGFPYLIFSKCFLLFYKIISAIIVVFSLKKYNSFKEFLKVLGLFFLYIYLFGGVLWGVINFLNIKYSYNGVLLYNFDVPISLILLLFIMSFWLFKNIVDDLKKQLKVSNYLYNIKLIDDGVSVSATGFYDSGNKLKIKGKYVNIISLDLFLKLHKEVSINNLILKKIDKYNLKNKEFITINGISKGDKFLIFTIDKMFVENDFYQNVTMAVALKNFDDFDCILSENYLGG